jgi:catalase
VVNLPVFPDSTPDGFYERVLASSPDPATGQPNPQAMSAFLAHPHVLRHSCAMTLLLEAEDRRRHRSAPFADPPQ